MHDSTVQPTMLRRRFRAGDMALHLDMVLVGELCLAVSVSGYQQLMNDFWSDATGQLGRLMDSLGRCTLQALPELAHTLKGSAATLGCVGLANLLRSIEKSAPSYQMQDCKLATRELLEHWQHTHALCRQAGFTSVPVLSLTLELNLDS